MGLFSFLNKNKQDGGSDDGDYVARDDDALAAKARSKRASSANEPGARRKEGRAAVDPVLPEKKRARRRLVGAIALALAVAIGLPMMLDSEPKPLATDIDIRIPSKEKAPPQPLPAPETVVAPSDALDKSEEIVEPIAEAVQPDDVARAREAAVQPGRDIELMAEPKIADKPPAKVAERKAEPVKVAARPAPKPDNKPDAKPDAKADAKAGSKPNAKPAVAKVEAKPEAERALAILEDKPAQARASDRYVVQVAALSSADKVTELQAKLAAAGVPSFTEKGAGNLVRVRVGPFKKEEGEKIRAKLVKLGLSGAMVPN